MKLLASVLVTFLLVSCASGPPAGPAPRACGLGEFAEVPGITFKPSPKGKAPVSKSAPAAYATPLDVDKGPADIGKWFDPAPGWKAWRLWLRSDEATSMAVQLQPFDLPPGAELWVCAPDGTSRQGPFSGRGASGNGELWSTAVRGPEVWLELLVPGAETDDVKLKIVKAFGGLR